MDSKQTEDAPHEYNSASQLHNDLTKPKANYKRSANRIIVALLLILAIVAILFYAKII